MNSIEDKLTNILVQHIKELEQTLILQSKEVASLKAQLKDADTANDNLEELLDVKKSLANFNSF